jgi:hypothetical protein
VNQRCCDTHLAETGTRKPEMRMPASNDPAEYLKYLQEAYTFKVNAALERDRHDLAAELADDYLDEVRRALEGISSPRG